MIAFNAGSTPVPRPGALARLAARVLRAERRPGRVNLVFCENGHIRDLNRRFRNLNRVTDVLSFPYGDADIMGEIYIATDQARKQAPRWKNSFYEELRRLVVHGALHLAGHDHKFAKERRIMQAKEDRYLTAGK